MKLTTAAATAAMLPVLVPALVLPDAAGNVQVPLGPAGKSLSGSAEHSSPATHAVQDSENSWLDILPSKESLAQTWDDAASSLSEGLDHVAGSLHKLMGTPAAGGVADGLLGAAGSHHSYPDATLYQLISKGKESTEFAKLIDEYPSIVKLLNSTSGANHTVFVPVDAAFEHLPKHHKPSKEFVEMVLLYHIGLGNYPARRILKTHTIPTAFNASLLGGDAQRLRTRVGLGGVTVNFGSKVVAVDIAAKNGIIHAVRSIVAPPPFAGRELMLFPDKFSTLLLAYDKTDFVRYIHGLKMVGTTVFAPSNHAFSRLGPKVNAFLFNTRTGLKYLDAILKYHVVANATLYSDAFYDRTGGGGSEAEAEGGAGVDAESQHFDLSTLLHDVHVGVDVGRVLGFITMRVNGFSHVVVQDGIAANGVIQVLDKVLIPPHKHKHEDAFSVPDDMSVEELKERLDAYVD